MSFPDLTEGRIWPTVCLLQNAKRPSGNEVPAVVRVGVQVLGGGEHLTEKYNSEVIFPVKSQLQSVTIMRRNDWERA